MPEADARLVELARSGDSAAFEKLVRRHLRAAYSVALATIGEPADAEDICQDAFITALERLDECRNAEKFLSWLLQIVRNRAHSVRRYQTVRRALPLDDALGSAGSEDPARDMDRTEIRQRLTEAMEGLTAIQREVVLLHDLQGWRHREIGELLGLPEGTVRAHLFHARRALRARLGTGLFEEA
ncbi:MAG TPA: RNA polymerase sigma factor [Longimicrobiales bacterium]|nr:RNA polymerase sigma factor [Longimicrobiales bacterium]